MTLGVAPSLSTLMTAACGTLVGAGVGVGGGAAVGTATNKDVGKSVLVGTLGWATYNITH